MTICARPLPTLATLALLAALLPGLSGCVPVLAVGAGAGALLISDRRYAETYLADEAIEIRASNRAGEKFGDKIHLNVTSYNRMLLLTGEVPDAATRADVEKVVSAVPNVKSVTNELQVAGISSLGGRSNDTFLTSKVKARFIDANKFATNHVKVVTESGVVYLLGLVTQKEADAAVDIARTTGGVQKVVKVLDVISDEEAKRLDARPAENTAPKQPGTP
jgi:osmotically-inducible protein OsmY